MVERSGGSVAGSHGRPRYLVAQGRLTALSVLLAVMLVLAARLPGAAASDGVSGESGASSMEWSDDNIKLHMDPFLVPVRPDDMALWPMSPRDQALIERMNVLNREYSRAFAADRFTFTELDIRPLVAFEALTAGLVPSKALQRQGLDPSVFWPTFLRMQTNGLIKAIRDAERDPRSTSVIDRDMENDLNGLGALYLILSRLRPEDIRSDGVSVMVQSMLLQVLHTIASASQLIGEYRSAPRFGMADDPQNGKTEPGGLAAARLAVVRFHAILATERFWTFMQCYHMGKGRSLALNYINPGNEIISWAALQLGLDGPLPCAWRRFASHELEKWMATRGIPSQPEFGRFDDWLFEDGIEEKGTCHLSGKEINALWNVEVADWSIRRNRYDPVYDKHIEQTLKQLTENRWTENSGLGN
ncbi:hypothetical protein CXG81DRAFT_21123 [Caulochytrium protostelioides]|uniref:Uncharacterized protein n=1 Tax=Caulochytrium protostelioides TaxID=1555241 RepID=A0A4P9WZ49_9FUNG|nr:hypothetical protein CAUPRSCDRAFT_10508 [Caulochytrium protostelioides]RKO98685.1 hypothetical protein CXG81DRAFT_21123 [Caulochytrium protostelioides]|eukprot:RKO98685.1 hypothetical protein CXG81DRAFT_21123 [Caulochytrium protostelioides]